METPTEITIKHLQAAVHTLYNDPNPQVLKIPRNFRSKKIIVKLVIMTVRISFLRVKSSYKDFK